LNISLQSRLRQRLPRKEQPVDYFSPFSGLFGNSLHLTEHGICLRVAGNSPGAEHIQLHLFFFPSVFSFWSALARPETIRSAKQRKTCTKAIAGIDHLVDQWAKGEVRPLHWLFRNHFVFLFRLTPAVRGRGSLHGRHGIARGPASFYTGSDSFNGTADLFVHVTALNRNMDELVKNDRVSFVVSRGRHAPRNNENLQHDRAQLETPLVPGFSAAR
jgi:cold shock CspA family protein